MSEPGHVSGMTVGGGIDQETHDAILETRKRRAKRVASATEKRRKAGEEHRTKPASKSKTEG